MSPDIEEFVSGVIDKVKIALALSIILNTPPGKMGEEYTKELQEVVNRKWHNQDDDPFVGRLLVERAHLRNQQHAVASQLSSLIIRSTKCTDSGYDSCEIHDDMDSALSSMFSDYLKPFHFSEDARKTLGANLDFIRGIVRLQALTGNDEIASHRFNSIINEINGQTTSECRTELQDAGVVSSRERLNYTVTSGVVQYTLQTTSAETIVKKSVQEIQRHLCGIALDYTELPYIISNWEGSLFQHSIAVIRRLSEEENFQKAIVISTGGLATVLITDMMENYGLEKNIKLENQITLLYQLCGNSLLCSEVLKILIEKVDLISAKCVASYQMESPFTPTERTVYLENCYYILNITEKLLITYFTMQQTCQSLPELSRQEKNEEMKIADLWRGLWEKQNKPKTIQSKPRQLLTENKELLKSWHASLENAAKVFAFNYPLITIYANNCLEIITGNQKNNSLKPSSTDSSNFVRCPTTFFHT